VAVATQRIVRTTRR